MTVTLVGSGTHTYEMDPDWARLPQGWEAPMAAVAVDSQDRVYGFNRGERPIIVFDREGNYLSSWGGGLFSFPHAITVDQEDNVWVVERNDQLVMKFTPDGRLLQTLGTKGYRSDTGADPTDFGSSGYRQVTHGGGPFNMPAGVAIAPSGDIFVADGYANCQVHRFASDGTLLLSWGEPGSGPGQFVLPHGIWVDRQGRLLVADRENNRVQVFTQEGEFLDQWPTEFIGPVAFFEDVEGSVYIPEHNGGSFSIVTPEGELLARWGSDINRSCHGVAGDSHGDIYVVQPGEFGRSRRVVKYTRQR